MRRVKVRWGRVCITVLTLLAIMAVLTGASKADKPQPEESPVERVIIEYKVIYQEPQGIRYYDIPEAYKGAGGSLPEEIQEYLWDQCKERELNYYIALALIERESGYRADASGDKGKSKGYMQVQERWHRERMKAESATDLFNPYDNIRVGLSFLDDLYEKYYCWNFALMAYNMGESKAEKLWNGGTFETEYSRYIQDRAEEIKQELQD